MANRISLLAAGVKFRGLQFMPSHADLVLGNLNAWYQMWYDLATDGGTRLAQWVGPQMDAAQARGCNCMRVMMCPALRVGPLTTLTSGQFNTMFDTLMTQLANRGMWMYYTPMASQDAVDLRDNHGVTTLQLVNYVGEAMARFSIYPNALAADVMQEVNFQGNSGTYPMDNMVNYIAIAKSTRVRPVPVTASYFAVDTTGLVPTYIQPAVETAGGEFRDLHIYCQPVGTEITALLAATSGLWMGEYGIQDDGTFTGAPTSTPTAFFTTMLSWAGNDAFQGLCNYAIADLNQASSVVQTWGMYNLTQDGSFAFTGLKTGRATLFDAQPKTVSYAAPSVFPTSTTASLTWTNFVPGATYTPQYIAVNSNNFPTEDTWHDGTPTAGLSGVLTGLSTSTHYAMRVQASL